MPVVAVKSFEIGKGEYASGETISGVLRVENMEENPQSGLFYTVELIEASGVGKSSGYVGEIRSELFSMAADSSSEFEVKYTVPYNVKKGSYVLRAEVFTEKGLALGWEDKAVVITEGHDVLLISKEKVYRNNVASSPLTGVIFGAGEKPRIFFNVLNSNSTEAEGGIIFKIFKRQAGGAVISEGRLGDLSVDAGKNADYSFEISSPAEPESYLVEIAVYDKDGNIISNRSYFRWVVSGASAELLSVEAIILEGGASNLCKEMPLKITYAGSADAQNYSDFFELKVEVGEKSGDKAVLVGEKIIKVSANGGTADVVVPVKNCVNSPLITARLVQDGKILDAYSIVLSYGSGAMAPSASGSSGVEINPLYIAIAVLGVIILIVALVFVLKAKKGGVQPPDMANK